MAMRCDVVWSGLGGSPYFSSLFSNASSAGSGPQDWADAVAACMNGLESVVSSALTWTVQPEITLFDATDGTITGTETITPGFGAGTDNGAVLPRATQGLAQHLTGIYAGGRQVRGRTFIPGPTEAVNDTDGTPSAGYISGAQAQFETHLLDADLAWGVWSRTQGAMFLIDSTAVSAEWAVLRSRRD